MRASSYLVRLVKIPRISPVVSVFSYLVRLVKIPRIPPVVSVSSYLVRLVKIPRIPRIVRPAPSSHILVLSKYSIMPIHIVYKQYSVHK